ncbi:MAG TPA: DUF4279 domain-containing protein [Steroidobacteraceae bacterium]
MSQYEFTISLQLRHPDIDPARITHAIGIEPQHTWKAGDPRRGTSDEPLEGVYRESYWMGRVMEEPQLSAERLSVESMLMQTLAHLRRAQSFLQRFRLDGGIAELHVSLFTRDQFNLELSPDSLSWLGRLGLAVALEIHPHSPHVASAAPN